jgi:transaldolase
MTASVLVAASPLLQTVSTTQTDYWNDSCSIKELDYAIGHGAVGATTNPNIVLNVLKQEMHLWDGRIREIIAENATWS